MTLALADRRFAFKIGDDSSVKPESSCQIGLCQAKLPTDGADLFSDRGTSQFWFHSDERDTEWMTRGSPTRPRRRWQRQSIRGQ